MWNSKNQEKNTLRILTNRQNLAKDQFLAVEIDACIDPSDCPKRVSGSNEVNFDAISRADKKASSGCVSYSFFVSSVRMLRATSMRLRLEE